MAIGEPDRPVGAAGIVVGRVLGILDGLSGKAMVVLQRGVSVRGVRELSVEDVRRLEAEVLIDAICQITGTTERYASPIPEPFTFLPEGHRAVSLPAGPPPTT